MTTKKIDLSEIELEFIANTALVFDGIIAEEKADLSHIAEVAVNGQQKCTRIGH
jgi:hypothetical protein